MEIREANKIMMERDGWTMTGQDAWGGVQRDIFKKNDTTRYVPIERIVNEYSTMDYLLKLALEIRGHKHVQAVTAGIDGCSIVVREHGVPKVFSIDNEDVVNSCYLTIAEYFKWKNRDNIVRLAERIRDEVVDFGEVNGIIFNEEVKGVEFWENILNEGKNV